MPDEPDRLRVFGNGAVALVGRASRSWVRLGAALAVAKVPCLASLTKEGQAAKHGTAVAEATDRSRCQTSMSQSVAS